MVLVLTLLGDFLLRRNRLVRFDLGHMRALLRYIVTERPRQLLAVVGEKLCIVCSARDGDIGHAAVEQIPSAQLGVHVNQDTVGSLTLAGVAGHGIAVVEMRELARIEFDRAATVHFHSQPPIFLYALDGAQLAVRNFQFVGRRGDMEAVAH